MDWSASADLSIRAVSTDPNGSGGHRGYHPPLPREEEDEARDEPEAVVDEPVDVVRISAADAVTRAYHAVSLLNTDFHLQWAALVADATTRGTPWTPRYRASDLQRQKYGLSLPTTPAETLVNRIITE